MSRIVDFITKNTWYKLSSVLLAVLVWAIVQGEEIVEFNKKIVVHIVVPENLIVREGQDFELDATVKGPRIIMGDLIDKKEIETSIYLSPNDSGDMKIRISRDYFAGWDDRINLQIHEPAAIQFFVDEKDTQKIAIREVLQGAPAEGYLVEKVTVKPKTVEVTGLKSELKRTKELTTESIDITGIQQSKTVEAAISTRNLTRAVLSEATASVTLQVGEAKENRKFSSIPIAVTGTDRATSIRPRFATIEIQGTPGVLSAIRPADLRAIVDLSNLPPGKFEKEIQVKIPPDTVLIDTFPQKVSITISDIRRRSG